MEGFRDGNIDGASNTLCDYYKKIKKDITKILGKSKIHPDEGADL